MERLTERTADGILVKENYEKESLKTLYSCYGEKPNSYYSNCEEGYCAMEKLADYEDLDEQGRLIKIPLEAYCIVDFKVRKGFVLEETYHMSRKPLLVVRYDDNSLKSHRGHLGISVFLTKSEAEAKLKELRGEENG